MVIKKSIEVKEIKKVSKCGCEEELKSFLVKKLPDMFDRTPDITGDLDKLVEEIISITCK